MVISPIVHVAHLTIKGDLENERVLFEAMAKYALNSSLSNLIKLIGAFVRVDLIRVGTVCTSVLIAGCVYFIR